MLLKPLESIPPSSVLEKESESFLSRSNKKIKRIAVEIFSNLASYTVVTSLFTFYAAIPLNPAMAMTIALVALAPISLHYVVRGSEQKIGESSVKRVATHCFAGISAGYFSGSYLHEIGHATAISFLYKNPAVRILTFPFRGGVTTYAKNKPFSLFGKILGPRLCLLAVTAAGTAATTVTAILALVAGEKLEETAPLLSDFFTGHAIQQICNEMLYGTAALTAASYELSNDFTRLWIVGGIHPLIPLSLLFLLPVAALLLMKQDKATQFPAAS